MKRTMVKAVNKRTGEIRLVGARDRRHALNHLAMNEWELSLPDVVEAALLAQTTKVEMAGQDDPTSDEPESQEVEDAPRAAA